MMEFPSLAGLANHLLQESVGGFLQVHEGLEAAAILLERESKAEIGTYQEGAGAFPSWPELAESTKADRVAKGFTENDPLLRSGELRDSITHEVDGMEAVIGSTSDIMLWQEVGTIRIPPRPVLGLALERNTDKVLRLIGGAAVHGLLGEKVKPTAEYLLNGLG